MAYDGRQCRSTSVPVAWGTRGRFWSQKPYWIPRLHHLFAAEARAYAQAVELGLEIRINKLEIEGDALTIIKKC